MFCKYTVCNFEECYGVHENLLFVHIWCTLQITAAYCGILSLFLMHIMITLGKKDGFFSSVIYEKAYIGFFVSWEIPFCLEKFVYFSTSSKVGIIRRTHCPVTSSVNSR
jgi:hypothetical protein